MSDISMNSVEVLERSLYWLRHVERESRDPVQRARVRERAEKMERSIAEIMAVTPSRPDPPPAWLPAS